MTRGMLAAALGLVACQSSPWISNRLVLDPAPEIQSETRTAASAWQAATGLELVVLLGRGGVPVDVVDAFAERPSACATVRHRRIAGHPAFVTAIEARRGPCNLKRSIAAGIGRALTVDAPRWPFAVSETAVVTANGGVRIFPAARDHVCQWRECR